MQLYRLPKNIHRDYFAALIAHCDQCDAPYTLELLQPPRSNHARWLLAMPRRLSSETITTFRLKSAIEHTVFHPITQAYQISHIIARTAPIAPVIIPYQLNLPSDEGLMIQYCITPVTYGTHAVTIRVVTTTPHVERAELRSVLLRSLFPQSNHKQSRNNTIDLVLLSERKADGHTATILTTTQLINYLPLAPTFAPHPLLEELKKEIRGEVIADEATLEQCATDGSIFRVRPWAVVIPADVLDIQTLVRWVSHKKQELRIKKQGAVDAELSITARGSGTDQAGGPLNSGIILDLSEFKKIKAVNKDSITVEPGVLWSTINEAIATRGRFVPSYPSSAPIATIGGGVANNCAGEKTVKYGSVREYIQSLKMIVEDGKEIELRRLSEWEVARKQAQTDREGEIYRAMYDLLIANHNLIENNQLQTNKSSTGYWLHDALGDQSIDLARVICGAQGTLGIITEIKLKTIPKPKHTGLLVATFENIEKAGGGILDLLQLRPSALEMMDGALAKTTRLFQDNKTLTAMLAHEQAIPPAIVLLIEFDGDDISSIQNNIDHAQEKIRDAAIDVRESTDPTAQAKWWKVRHSAALVAEHAAGKKKGLPFIEDVTVHPRHLALLLKTLYRVLQKHGVTFSIWGHAGSGNIHLQPFLDLSNEDDREKLLIITDVIYAAVIALHGAISGEHNDGIIRTPYLKEQFGKAMFEVFKKVKHAFDPLNIFNPGKKIGIDKEFIKKHMRHEYGGKRGISS